MAPVRNTLVGATFFKFSFCPLGATDPSLSSLVQEPRQPQLPSESVVHCSPQALAPPELIHMAEYPMPTVKLQAVTINATARSNFRAITSS